MTESEKISLLLSTWVDVINVENLTTARVSAGDDDRRRIWDSGVSLRGDNLLLEEPLFKEFKQLYQETLQKKRTIRCW